MNKIYMNGTILTVEINGKTSHLNRAHTKLKLINDRFYLWDLHFNTIYDIGTYIEFTDNVDTVYNSADEALTAISEYVYAASGSSASSDLTEDHVAILNKLSLVGNDLTLDGDFYADSMNLNPGSVYLGNIKIESSNHGVGYLNITNNWQGLLTVQGYTKNGSDDPTYYEFGERVITELTTGFDTVMPSETITLPTETVINSVLVTGYVIKANAPGTIALELKNNNADGTRVTTFDIVVTQDMLDRPENYGNDLVTLTSGEILIEFHNHYILENGRNYYATLTGDPILLGSGTFPWIPYYRREEQPVSYKSIPSKDYVNDEILKLYSPSYNAFDSNDQDIIYGGFRTTGVIRKRIISTGIETFFQSSVTLPVIDPTDWGDWQNRESLIYN